LRLNRTEALLLELRFIENPSHHCRKVGAWREIAAVGAQIDTAEDDFFRARNNESANFFDNSVRRQATASPTNKRNHTVRAAIVAAILNLQDRAGAVTFHGRAQRCLYFHRGRLRENVAGQNLRRASCERHRAIPQICERKKTGGRRLRRCIV
jgi:hypothetical protein